MSQMAYPIVPVNGWPVFGSNSTTAQPYDLKLVNYGSSADIRASITYLDDDNVSRRDPPVPGPETNVEWLRRRVDEVREFAVAA